MGFKIVELLLECINCCVTIISRVAKYKLLSYCYNLHLLKKV